MIVREYPQSPVVAVGGIILQEGKVLLVRRGQEPLRNQWSIPGGAVEVGEKLAEALRREILEETGLAVRVGKIVEVLDRIIPDEQGRVHYHYVLVDYLCRVEGGRLQPSSDASEACWAHRLELVSYALRPETLRVIEKAFSIFRTEGTP
jgi:8-oxo-dGTP diphosphatase